MHQIKINFKLNIMKLSKRDSISNLICEVQALNNLQSEYFNQMLFINEIREKLHKAYDSKISDYNPQLIKELINTITNQIGGFEGKPETISNDNYHLNNISKNLTAQIQEIL